MTYDLSDIRYVEFMLGNKKILIDLYEDFNSLMHKYGRYNECNLENIMQLYNIVFFDIDNTYRTSMGMIFKNMDKEYNDLNKASDNYVIYNSNMEVVKLFDIVTVSIVNLYNKDKGSQCLIDNDSYNISIRIHRKELILMLKWGTMIK